MAGSRNKTSAQFQPSGETKRIVGLGGGYAYLFDHKGKTHHLPRTSPEFVSLCATEDEHFEGRIVRELEALGWTEVLELLASCQDSSAE